MKKLLAVASVGALFLPAVAFAAFNDATITTSATLTVGGVSVDISGSSAVIESLTVNASSLVFTLQPGSSIKLSASGLNKFSSNTATDITTDTCTGVASVLGYTGSAARTVTVQVGSALCSNTSGGTTTPDPVPAPSSSGSGGGGGSSSAPTVSAAPVTTTTNTVTQQDTLNALQAQLANLQGQAKTPSSGGASFKRDLTVNATGADVKTLQLYLNGHGYIIAKTGAGSPGGETTKFGGLTRAALIKLQKAAGISPASGYFGPKTRAYVEAHP